MARLFFFVLCVWRWKNADFDRTLIMLLEDSIFLPFSSSLAVLFSDESSSVGHFVLIENFSLLLRIASFLLQTRCPMSAGYWYLAALPPECGGGGRGGGGPKPSSSSSGGGGGGGT